MDLKSVRTELDGIVNDQELSATNYHHLIDEMIKNTQALIIDLQSADDTSSTDHKSVIKHLRGKLDAYGLQLQEQLNKDKNVDLSKYPEILGKFVETDISKAHRDVKFDSRIVNQIILNQLFHQGLFHVAEIFISETQEPDMVSEMHQILDALKARNLEPAVNWMSVNRQKLDNAGSNLEFDLRQLQFLELLKENKLKAAEFAETYLSPFASKRVNEYFELSKCLWTENLETSPYAHLLSPEKWVAVSQELMVQFCGGSRGMSSKDPLAVTVDAGAQALPTFLEFATMPENREEWAAMKESPVTVELGKEFQFHSIFVCPVTWEETDKVRNPPAMLPCGHVLSCKAIWHLSNEHRQTFKCPYNCLLDVSSAQCQQLFL